ncbi:methyltransferase domain-containing protein [Brevibacillus agri]|uniref:class I SAM-dependent methyltransferase n=2 Tax=Brevibacillus agri TaxID=51101 RepID=UPI0018CCFCC7|nr:methyltransferase domain-containing protein [Brevibacillus agri]MBG9566682.1 phospholipid methyltransferase [Brevibacillus agri]MBY0052411.1 methyltransferase domain-containing protein [Brevibacillus agri]MED1645495.1 methyltransferase domain-containing protein [Brevibacillus agri]MED1654955.1 methyltransferase domain-containing protein [Brevibacillus agri]MED1685875.1 methyltransferase domain-containing protein [Brevibacillus agri]
MMIDCHHPVSIKDRLMFFYNFLQSPGQVGSITPSSRALAKQMMKPIDWSQAHTIVELGAGTGIFTTWIEQMKRPEATLVSFEKENKMREKLEQQFPNVLFHEDAVDLTRVLGEAGLGKADCIVSGLPFANFPQELRDQIMDEVYAALKPGGVFVTFQYSLQMKKQLSTVFENMTVKLVPLNLPPAFVYVCRKGHE